jgi:hypothetical protein
MSLFAQERGLQVTAVEKLGVSTPVGKQYAFFIAIDSYRNWPALKKPVADAREIRDILKDQYYIDEVIELYNRDATRGNIVRTFAELQKKITLNDSLFIYYAGHGHLDKASNTGFWIPVDGGTDVYSQDNWLPNSQIRGLLSQMQSIHVFMVSDACFSGDILNTTRAMTPMLDDAYYRNAYGMVSRQVLTSGASETVPDESEFSQALKLTLKKNNELLLDPVGIYTDIRKSVTKTVPLYGTLNQANHQDGATFLFFRKPVPVIAAPVSEPEVPIPPPPPQAVSLAAPLMTSAVSVGSLSVTSAIAGTILIDGNDTGAFVRAGGTVVLQNVISGATIVAIQEENGKITKANGPVIIRADQTMSVQIGKLPPPPKESKYSTISEEDKWKNKLLYVGGWMGGFDGFNFAGTFVLQSTRYLALRLDLGAGAPAAYWDWEGYDDPYYDSHYYPQSVQNEAGYGLITDLMLGLTFRPGKMAIDFYTGMYLDGYVIGLGAGVNLGIKVGPGILYLGVIGSASGVSLNSLESAGGYHFLSLNLGYLVGFIDRNKI